MPEGPEVLRCGRDLHGMIKDKTLHQLKPVSGKLMRQLQPVDFGLKVSDVIVKGKSIFIQLEDGREIYSSLGMSGWWYPPYHEVDDSRVVYYRGKTITAREIVLKALKHARVELVVDGPSAYYVDPRNFGNLKIVSGEEAKSMRNALGLDMLAPDINGLEAVERLKQHPTKEIGEILLNQGVLCGFGNIYRAETLYICRINPFRMVKSLSNEELRRIVDVGAYVLALSYTHHGMLPYEREKLSETLDYLPNFERIKGPMVYGRRTDVYGYAVNSSGSAGRTIWWVPEIQR
jgi:endonuclease VIII